MIPCDEFFQLRWMSGRKSKAEHHSPITLETNEQIKAGIKNNLARLIQGATGQQINQLRAKNMSKRLRVLLEEAIAEVRKP